MKAPHLLIAMLFAAFVLPASASACGTPTKAGEKLKRERERQYLRDESDAIVRGIWRADKADRDPENEYRASGYIEVAKSGLTLWFRVSIPGEINCGFPNYDVYDGDVGKFYLKKDDTPDENGLADGFNDDFSYIHFEPLKRNDN